MHKDTSSQVNTHTKIVTPIKLTVVSDDLFGNTSG